MKSEKDWLAPILFSFLLCLLSDWLKPILEACRWQAIKENLRMSSENKFSIPFGDFL